MKKRFLIVSIITLLLISIAIPAFAMGNVANGVRNFVGDTENMIEGAGSTAANGIRNGFNTIGQGTENVMTDVKDGIQNTGNSMVSGMATGNNGGGYTATRTTGDEIRVAGMTTNTWTWIIVAATAIAIGVLVWSYIRQKNNNDLYIDTDDE